MAAINAGREVAQQYPRTMVSLGSATAGAGVSFIFGMLIGHARGWRSAMDAIEARLAAEHRSALFRQHKDQMDHQAALDRLAASNGRAADAINADVNDRLIEYLYSSKYRPLQDRLERAVMDEDSAASRDADRWLKGFGDDDYAQGRGTGDPRRRFDADRWRRQGQDRNNDRGDDRGDR